MAGLCHSAVTHPWGNPHIGILFYVAFKALLKGPARENASLDLKLIWMACLLSKRSHVANSLCQWLGSIMAGTKNWVRETEICAMILGVFELVCLLGGLLITIALSNLDL